MNTASARFFFAFSLAACAIDWAYVIFFSVFKRDKNMSVYRTTLNEQRALARKVNVKFKLHDA